ncbi:MAG: hypothetical protein WC838_00560 [Candidatus Margulisiibacteriota bacterium]|jgi:hypothetical protein
MIVQCAWAVFTFTINDHFIDFGQVNIGESKFGVPADNLRLTCRSDRGQQWLLQIKGNDDLSSGSFTLPIKNLQYFGTYANSIDDGFSLLDERSFPKDTTSLQLSDRTFYRSDRSGDSVVTGGTVVYLQFGLTIPDTQPAGTYGTNLIFTMTE